MADIRNPETFAAGRWAYDASGLSSAFPRKISPTDVDGFVEISGRGLFLEHKEYDPEIHDDPLFMPRGQKRAYQWLATREDTTVLYVAGRALDCTPWWVMDVGSGWTYDMRSIADADERRGKLHSIFTIWQFPGEWKALTSGGTSWMAS